MQAKGPDATVSSSTAVPQRGCQLINRSMIDKPTTRSVRGSESAGENLVARRNITPKIINYVEKTIITVNSERSIAPLSRVVGGEVVGEVVGGVGEWWERWWERSSRGAEVGANVPLKNYNRERGSWHR